MPARRREVGIPCRLPIEVRVDVDESRRHHQAVGIDRPVRGPVDSPDLHDEAVLDGDVGSHGIGAGAVDDGSAANDEVVGHDTLLVSPA
jgi:hypothetical protein